MKRIACVVLGLSLLGVVANANEATVGRPALRDEYHRLVPRGTQAIVYVESLDGASAKVRRVAAAIGEDVAEELDLDEILGRILPDASIVDRSKPFCIAATELTGAPPVMIFSAKNAEDLTESFTGYPVVIRGNVCALFRRDEPGADDPLAPILANLPRADLVARLDLAGLLETFSEQIDMVIERQIEPAMVQNAEARMILGPMLRWFDKLTAEARFLDAIVNIEGTEVDLRLVLETRAGGELDSGPRRAGDFGTLLRGLPEDHAIGLLMNCKMDELIETILPFYESLAEALPEGEALVEMMRGSVDIYRGVGPEVAASYGFGPTGLELVMITPCEDPQGFVAKFDEWLQSFESMEWGMTLEDLPDERVGDIDIKVSRWLFDFTDLAELQDLPPDAAEIFDGIMNGLFGEEGWELRVAAKGQDVVMSLAGSAERGRLHIERALNRTAGARPDLARMIQRSNGLAVFGMSLELRALTRRVVQFVAPLLEAEGERVPKIPDGDPLWLLLWVDSNKNRHGFQMTVDVGATAKFFKAIFD